MTRPGWARPERPEPPPQNVAAVEMYGEIVEPRREVVEVHDDDGTVVYLVEPTTAVRAELDGVPHRLADLDDVELSGVSPGALVIGPDGIARPVELAALVAEHQRGSVIHLEHALAERPGDAATGEYVIVISGPDPGAVYRMEE